MEKKVKLLLVEDDAQLTYVIKDTLERFIGGYEITTAANGKEGLKAYNEMQPDIIIADVDMPEMNGFEMVERIREVDADVPVLFASGMGSPTDVLNGYELGADGYVKKPFVAVELDAHMRAILKRRNGQRSVCEKNCFRFGIYTLDVNHAMLINNETNETRTLSVREAGILRMLALSKNKVVRRGVIISHNWTPDDEDDYFVSRSLDTYINKLRKYLQDDPKVAIKTVRGVGLMLVDGEECP